MFSERDLDLMDVEAEAFLDEFNKEFEIMYKGARHGDLQGEENAISPVTGGSAGNESGSIPEVEPNVGQPNGTTGING